VIVIRSFASGLSAEPPGLTGQVVGAAESECMPAERRWANADDYARRSMAQTRATSKALRQPLGFVMQLAGFDATPADEIPELVEPDKGTVPPEIRPTPEQKRRIGELVAQLAEKHPCVDWRAEARRLAGCAGDKLTGTIASMLIDQLEARLKHEAAAA
jgi:hypothetical protein